MSKMALCKATPRPSANMSSRFGVCLKNASIPTHPTTSFNGQWVYGGVGGERTVVVSAVVLSERERAVVVCGGYVVVRAVVVSAVVL